MKENNVKELIDTYLLSISEIDKKIEEAKLKTQPDLDCIDKLENKKIEMEEIMDITCPSWKYIER